MLNNYMQRTQQFLADMKQEIINPALLVGFINTARGQLAGEAECIRVLGTINTIVLSSTYSFGSINIGVPASTGIQGVINVRQINNGNTRMTARPWEYFNYYYKDNPSIAAGPPTRWAQYGQGSSQSVVIGTAQYGTFFINPLPDIVYTLTCDCIGYPIPLATDTTVEAIPYLWTDAISFLAAYYAYMSVLDTERADKMYGYYQTFVQRARQAANPPLDRWMYQQATIAQGVDPTAQRGT